MVRRLCPSQPACETSLRDDIVEMLREQIEFRELFRQMTLRDLRLRYKQTFMGFAWALFVPLLNTVMFSILFTRVAPMDTRPPYPVFAYCGFLVWNLTAASLRSSVNCLTTNTTLVTKVYFPREIFPFAAVAVSLVDLVVAASVLVAMLAYYRVAPTSALALLPAVLAVQLAFTTSVALLLSMANAFYRDVKYLFEAVLTIWMFASAVMYPLDSLGHGMIATVVRVNPMTAVIDAYRHIILWGQPPDIASFGWAVAVSLVLLPASWITFHRLEFRFAETV
jgi:lipopolysaccharide transport system permease protein